MNRYNLTEHRIVVLLIDDQPIVGESVRRMLATEHDIDFHYCQDPTRAIKEIDRIKPTVILQDLVMPQVDGLSLVRYLRASKTSRDVPLIVLSSKEEPQIKAEAFALGANDYMVKLPDRLEVLARVRYHSRGYINLLQRNEAYEKVLENQKQLEMYNRFIRKTFGRYLSDDIVDSILESSEGMKMGGEKRKVTILMSDLRGFTSIGERLPPENVVSIINIYLEAMTDIIMKYGGTIDEFIGDAILVIFGAPVQKDDDTRRAVACAVEMQLAMEEVNRQLEEGGYTKVAMGIGLNTGEVVVGNIGSKKRTKYGVVGKNVNLTSRIESYTVGGQIYASERTVSECGDLIRIDDQMEVMPKGVKQPIVIYRIGGIGGEYDVFLPVEEKRKFVLLKQPLEVEFTVLAGKHAGSKRHRGALVAADAEQALVGSETTPEKLTNLKIHLFDMTGKEIAGDLYGKVAGPDDGSPERFKVVFTSVPPEAEAFLGELTEGDENMGKDCGFSN